MRLLRLDPAAGYKKCARVVGDVIAGHGLTPFLAAAEAAGCRTANGGQMVEAVQELMVEFMVGEQTT